MTYNYHLMQVNPAMTKRHYSEVSLLSPILQSLNSCELLEILTNFMTTQNQISSLAGLKQHQNINQTTITTEESEEFLLLTPTKLTFQDSAIQTSIRKPIYGTPPIRYVNTSRSSLSETPDVSG